MPWSMEQRIFCVKTLGVKSQLVGVRTNLCDEGAKEHIL